MKFTKEIAGKINKGSVFSMRLFKKYRLGSELERLSKLADVTMHLYNEYESLSADLDCFFARADKLRYAHLYEIDRDIKHLKLKMLELENMIKNNI